MITNWIEKKDAKDIRNKNDSLYKFDLIYRGSQNGVGTNSFRYQCKNLREPILVLVRCQNSKKIFGGFTSVGFYYHSDYDKWIDSADSFVFSLEKDDYQSIKLSRVTSYDHAIHNNKNKNNHSYG